MTQLQNLGLGSWPRRRAALSPDHVAIEFEETSRTYAQLADRVEKLSGWLADSGVRAGDRVAYWGGNHPALLETLFAATRLGAVAVLINARLTGTEAEFILRDSGATALFFGREQAEDVLEAAEHVGVELLVDVDNSGRARDYSGTSSPNEVAEVNSGLDDPAVILYTSGTTGRPKGAVLTHGNILFNDINVLIENDIRPDEVCLAAAPLFHIAGLNGLVLPTFLKGGTIVVHRNVEAERILAEVQNRGITSMFAVPAMLDALSAHSSFDGTDLSTLRTIVVGGAPVPARTLQAWTERNVSVQQGYGLTETSPAVLKLSAEDGIRKVGSAGKPQFFVDVRLTASNGAPAAIGEVGEIQTVGPNVMHEYWQRPEATAEAFSGGWFRTGDAAVEDDDGYYWIRDRYKDMYVSGGENIYPAEVESALMDIPGIVEAAVIGVSDDRWGEVGRAFIVLEGDAELEAADVRTALGSSLSRFKIPKQIQVIDRLPRTTTGKLIKIELRELI
ncbi:long-chain fatty acid--CoA ligase [Brevibacterium sp. BDJS002]|uniref:acyl-CoA synthetase n=1 Tax=Brevibacterium sp. BDJS002 TaxID=3020906 RepID=UPI002307A5F3|nr:long-chain fatty acid--CoA ligase [Brevibacterium sp. BDJS002]WCE41134.1 long-chain fatty acid--CoA ligase [Brevibacterium sp. BDJS002]